MASRRARLQIKPNIGSKVVNGGPTPTSRPIKNGLLKKQIAPESEPTGIFANNVDAESGTNLIGEHRNINDKTKLTSIRTAENSVDTDMRIKASPLKSPNQANTNGSNANKNMGTTVFQSSGGNVARATRNRLPKPKPNITPRNSTTCTKSTSEPHSVEKDYIQDENLLITADIPSRNFDSVQTRTLPLSPEKFSNNSQLKHEKDIKPAKRYRGATYRKFPENEPPDRQKMTMGDLIYWNPSNNPMKQSGTKIKKCVDSSTCSINESSSINSSIHCYSSDASIPVQGLGEISTDNSMLVPQVTIGPDGSMIINEQSLIVEAEKEPGDSPLKSEVVEEDDMFVNYNSFRNKGPTKSWFDNETARFYRALSALGTDFSLMSSLFPHRTRRELKNKFKREEKYNRKLVDQAIHDRTPLNLDNFESIESVLERDRIGRMQKKKVSIKRKRVEKHIDILEDTVDEIAHAPSSPKKSKKHKTNIGETKSKNFKLTVEQKTLAKLRNRRMSLEYEEYQFDSEDEEEPLPARLPKLTKSPPFKEFSNTAAKKLHEVCSRQTVSEDDEDDEDDDVDILDCNNVEEDYEPMLNSMALGNQETRSSDSSTSEMPITREQANISILEAVPPELAEITSEIELPQTIEKECQHQKSLTKLQNDHLTTTKAMNRRSKFKPNVNVTQKRNSQLPINTERQLQEKGILVPDNNVGDRSITSRTVEMDSWEVIPTVDSGDLQEVPEGPTVTSLCDDGNVPMLSDCQINDSNHVESNYDAIVNNDGIFEPSRPQFPKNKSKTTPISKRFPSFVEDTSKSASNNSVLSISSAKNYSGISSFTSVSTTATTGSVSVPSVTSSDSVASPTTSNISATDITVDGNMVSNNSPHFVLPANVFPNMPFTETGDKMQMILVPETKDGETIYHVYIVPENGENKNNSTLSTNDVNS